MSLACAGASLAQAAEAYKSPKFQWGFMMAHVFEVIDDDGAVRIYAAKFMRREANKLVVLHRGLEMSFAISHIRDWCAVGQTDEFPVTGTKPRHHR